MIFDLTPIAFLAICCLPGGVLRWLFTWGTHGRWILLAGAGLTFTLNAPIAFALAHAFLVLSLIRRWRIDVENHLEHSTAATLLFGACAAVWPLELVLIYEWQPTSAAPAWVLDLVNRYLRALLEALPLEADPGVAVAVLEQAARAVRGAASHVIALSFAGGLFVTLGLYEILRAKLPELPERAARLQPVAPRWAVAGSALLWIASRLRPESWSLGLLAQVPLGLFLATGTASLYGLCGSSTTTRAAFGAFVVVAIVEPRAAAGVALWGLVDGILQASPWLDRHTPTMGLARARLREGLVTLRTWVRPGPVLIPTTLLLGALVVSAIHEDIPYPGDAPEPQPVERMSEAAGRIELSSAEGQFTIERFEAPNRLGSLPTVAVTPHQAETLCQERGLELCTEQQWVLACSTNRRHDFFVTVPEGKHGMREARLRCNLGRGHATRAGSDTIAPATSLLPSGEDANCTNPLGLHDMVGNAFEWVRLEDDRLGFHALAGGYYGTTDAITARCSRPSLIHDAQLFAVDLEGAGFRCCGEARTQGRRSSPRSPSRQ